jgi:hypothetical protein
LLFIHGSGKKGAFGQKDYLAQVLERQLTPILKAFAAIRCAAARNAFSAPEKPMFRQNIKITMLYLHVNKLPYNLIIL